jgi:hypothetical protein
MIERESYSQSLSREKQHIVLDVRIRVS